MEIKQFYDKGLAHASYAILSNGEVALVDPARDPEPYFDYAKQHNAEITKVLETHPHADFVSSHLEIGKKTGATIYVSPHLKPFYDHKVIDDGDNINHGKGVLKILGTPGHSPDSISIVAVDENGHEHAVFTGDSLFIGDVGRPDLREKAGNIHAQREQLARQMYQTTRNVFMQLSKDIEVYPAHGAGSLCGKNLSSDLSSTIGKEMDRNTALQPMDEEAFVSQLLEGQPYIPKYFPHSVEMNRKGAPDLEESVSKVQKIASEKDIKPGTLIIDGRSAGFYQKGYLPGSINIPDDTKFETWLGTIVSPDESFYLIAENDEKLNTLVRKAAKIGYEGKITGALVQETFEGNQLARFDFSDFMMHPDDYTILDVRQPAEAQEKPYFKNAINVPLSELREQAPAIKCEKPVVIHCAGGYRSAIGASIMDNYMQSDQQVMDMSENIKQVEYEAG